MTNPIIDAIEWDPDNPGASAFLLQTQLALLQAEWDTKVSRFLELTAVGAKSLSSFQDLPRNRDNELDLYVGLDPAEEFVDSTLRYVRGELTYTLPFAEVGHKERIYLTQTSVLTPNAAVNTTFLYSGISATLPRPAFVRGFHPLIIKSAGANGCSNLFRPQIDNAAIFSGNPTGGASGDPRPGIRFSATVLNTESFVILEWATSTAIAAGAHSFRMDIIDLNIPAPTSPANVAPFFDIYTSAIEVGTMPTSYVQPPLSYLEFIYQ